MNYEKSYSEKYIPKWEQETEEDILEAQKIINENSHYAEIDPGILAGMIFDKQVFDCKRGG